MRTEVIKADTIDAAVDGILDELNKDTRSRENVIYFDGWDGLGASAVLRAVVQRLSSEAPTRPPGLQFEQIIDIDCSKWESTRAVQSAIAEQLKLPSPVMEMFDEQDDEDDFSAVVDRADIAGVAAEIQRSLQGRRFLLVLHNGSNEEIDISNIGLPVYGYLSNKILWTFQGRFRLDAKSRDRMKKNTTDVFLSASRFERDPQELWSYLLREEAAQVSCKCGIDPAVVVECFLYMLKLYCIGGHHIVEYDFATHSCNYWTCDGIIQQQATDIGKAWQVGDALQHEMRLDMIMDYYHNAAGLPSHLIRYAERVPYWISTATCGFVMSPGGVIPSNNMFQHSDRLGVLKLSRCTFNFSSPPFLCCRSLRFLWLDRCQDLLTTGPSTTTDQHADAAKQQEEEELLDKSSTATSASWACFHSLWVLDLRYTDWDWILSAQMMDLMTQLRELNIMGAKNWDMSHLRGRLRNIRKLRVQKSRCCNYDSSLLSEMERMELLEFSGNNCTTTTQGGTTSLLSLCGAARNSGGGLQTVIIDGCDEFEKISLQGCAQLKNLFLRGLFKSLVELDLSGTTLQTMDLSTMQLPRIQRLLLLGCEQLRAILWPPEEVRRELEVLRIDTTPRSSSSLVPHAHAHAHAHPRGGRSLQEQKEEKLNKGWRISVTDARLLRSLYPVRGYLPGIIHIDICPAATVGVGVGVPAGTSKSSTEAHTLSTPSMVDSSKYRDVFKEVAAPPAYNYDDDGPTPSAVVMMWDCPKIYTRRSHKTCIIEVMIMHEQEDRKVLLEGAAQSSPVLSLRDFICDMATSLHVYDNSSSMTSIPAPPGGSRWYRLRWCRVERCPKLHTVFTPPQDGNQFIFYDLRTFWASQLLTARYVWNWPSTSQPGEGSFQDLIFLHVDYCPRLIHVLPLSTRMATLCRLETLEIVCCGDLREVFPLDPERQEQHSPVIEFPRLKRIHLHELPKLQHICGRKVSAPRLETVKIRGCWSLRRLPAVPEPWWDHPGHRTAEPKVDCEKEWWDRLEWDGMQDMPSHSSYRDKVECVFDDSVCMQDRHDPFLYQPSHSSYYKKAQLPRGTLLR